MKEFDRSCVGGRGAQVGGNSYAQRGSSFIHHKILQDSSGTKKIVYSAS
jgi:hypothetical protein